MKRIGGGALAVILALLCPVAPAAAAGDASDVVVDVTDAASGAPVSLARVLLGGETGTIGYTDAGGRARFESVPTGTYRAAVTKNAYAAAQSALFDVVANRSTTVRVRLARAGLKTIGGVSVTSSPARASREVGQDDALRHLDGSLRDALGDIPGVTGSGGGISIDGGDPSQTGTTVDGVPIPGAGGAFGARGINADLFASAGASSGAAHGSLGGNLAFRTLQPTRFAQQQATLQYGSGHASSAQFAARGSIGNLGYVLQHASRGITNPLTGAEFTDESGLTYAHDGDAYAAGDLAKLRWSPSIAHTLTLTGSATSERDGLACAQQTAHFPCGYGPGVNAQRRGAFATLAESATIGATSLFAAGFVSGSREERDGARAYFAGAPAPSADTLRSTARGLSLSLQLPAGSRHDLAIDATSYGLTIDGTARNALGSAGSSDRVAYRAATAIDRIRPNDRLTITARAGVNGGSGNASVATGLGVHWQPFRDLAYDLTAAAGDAGSAVVVANGGLPDPRSLTFDCADGLAVGGVPAVNAARQRSSSLRGSVERSGKHARVALTAWTQRLAAAPVLAAFDGSVLGLPPSYAQTARALAASPYVCGSSATPSLAFDGFVPADQLARGATLAGTWQIGAALLAGFATVQSRFVTAGTPLTAALTPPGAQVPDVPLHRAGLVATQRLGKAVDLLANVSFTSAGNPNRLPAYTLVNAGFAAPLRYGTIALVGRNLTNRFAGPVLGLSDVRALPRVGGAALPLLASPLAPRSVALTYTVRAGRLGSGGNGAGTTEANAEGDDPHGVTLAIHGTRLPDVAPPEALTIDADSEECTPVAARAAQPVLDAVGALRDAAARARSGGRYPQSLPGSPRTVSGVTLRYVGYDDAARYAVVVGGPIRATAAVINCVRVGIARPDDVATRHLYVEAAEKGAGPFFLAYSPLAGLYLIPPAQPVRGSVEVNATLDDEPASAPAEPFKMRASCPASSRPLADAVVAALQRARAAVLGGAPVPPSEIAEITVHGAGPGAWFAIVVKGLPFAVLQCLHVAAVPRDHLGAAGIADDRRNGALGFADRFGFYQIGDHRPRGG